MSRSLASRSSIAASLLVAGLSLAACRDGVVDPVRSALAPRGSHRELLDGGTRQAELTVLVGDTLNVGEQALDEALGGEFALCASDDESVASIYRSMNIIGQAAGDVSLQCTRVVGERLRLTYMVTVHVRERAERPSEPAGPEPVADPRSEPDPDTMRAARLGVRGR